jgi:ABC-type transporter Mla subunit MlaD
MRINKTVKNLQTIWQQLDNASGELYNALDNLARMVELSDEIKRQADMIDITRIDGLKQEIEDLIHLKKENGNEQRKN